MHHQLSPLSRRAAGAALIVCALCLLAVASVAQAGWLIIDTNNGAVDTPTTPLYTSTCNNGSIADYLEIKNAWIVHDGNGFYFRLEACAATTGTQLNSLRLGAGFDCNSDGDVADGYVTGPDGDRKAIYWPNADQVWLYSGSNQQIIQLPDLTYGERLSANYEWWLPLDKLYPGCRASTVSVGLTLGTAQLVGGAPQERDTLPLQAWSHPIDYGDANNPDPTADPPTCTQYPTRIGCNGARHGVNSALRLGALVDADGGNAYNTDATGDDLDNVADEDGVAPTPGVWTPGGQGSLDATVSWGSGYLNCWVDWNSDNDWADANERIVNDAAAVAGLSTHTFSVPSVTFPNTFTARCRLAPGAGQATAVTGAVEFGEVEDHRWAFGATGNRPAPVTLAIAIPAATTNVQLSWGAHTANEDYLILSSTRPYFAADDGDVTTTVDGASPYLDGGKVGAPAEARFYAAQGRVTSSTPDLTSALSNRVGLFEFTLTPGG